MNWTKKPPTEPGYFWLEGNPERGSEIVWVEELSGDMMFQKTGLNHWFQVSNFLKRRWQGPLPVPPEEEL